MPHDLVELAPGCRESQIGPTNHLPILRKNFHCSWQSHPEILFSDLLRQVKGGTGMSKELAIIHYRASMSIFNSWASKGIITEAELLTIDTMVAQKYGLSFDSIYRL